MVLIITETKSPSRRNKEPGDVAFYKRLKDLFCPGEVVEFEGVRGIGNIFKSAILERYFSDYSPSKILLIVDSKGYEDVPALRDRATALFNDWDQNLCKICLVVVNPDMDNLLENLLPEDKINAYREQREKIGKVLAPAKFVRYIDENRARENPIVSLYIKTIRCNRCEKP